MKSQILIVDNDESIIRCLELMLRSEFEVHSAKSGNEALEKLNLHKIECIISDHEMDDGDGLFLIKNLKKKEIPFILVTGQGEKNVFKEFANENAFHIYEKPISTNLLEVIRSAIDSYKKTQQRLKESLIGRNTGHIIHDLNNGLSIIEASSKAGLKIADSDTSQYITMSLNACRQLSAMITKYKSFMKDNGELQLSSVELNSFLKELINECLITLENGIRLEFIPAAINVETVIDPDLLRQVVLNLISNSVFAIKEIPNSKVQIRLLKSDDSIAIEVEDSGSIPPDVAANLFKEGFSTKGEEGSGMGLVYCRDLLSKISGHLTLSNASPTTFSIFFEKP